MATVPRLLERYFNVHAGVIGGRPHLVLCASLLVAAVANVGWLRFTVESDLLHLFSPADSEWKADRQRFTDFFNMTNDSLHFVFVTARDEQEQAAATNLLSAATARRVVGVLDFLESNLTVEDGDGHVYRYLPTKGDDESRRLGNVDSPFYRPNRLTKAYLENVQSAANLTSKGRRRKAKTKLTYPVTNVFGSQLFLPFVFGGVRYNTTTLEVTRVKALLMRYLVKEANVTGVSANFSRRLEAAGGDADGGGTLRTSVYSWDAFLLEIQQVTFRTLRLVPAAVAMVLLFTVGVCVTTRLKSSGHCHAVGGLLSVVLSFSTAMGLMFWAGLRYNDLIAVTSFLSLAIGVDDTFIMMKAWRRHLHVEEPRLRLQQVMMEAGPSITFTSLTDIIAFAVGATMKIPALRDFCVTTAVSIACDLLFQVTFFPACMVLLDRRKVTVDQLHRKFSDRVIPRRVSQLSMLTLEQAADTKRRLPDLVDWLKRLVSWRSVQTVTLVVMAILNTVGLYGITRLRPNTELNKLLVDDSYMQRDANLFQRYFWGEALLFNVVVTSPDFSKETEVDDFLRFVRQLETLPLSVGSASTDLWTREFLAYALEWNDGGYGAPMDATLHRYLLQKRASLARDVRTRWKDDGGGGGSRRLLAPAAFHFTTGFWGVDSWEVRADLLRNLSAIRAQHPRLQPSFFNEMVFVTDLLIYTDTAIKQTLGIVLITTFFICALFIPLGEPRLVFLVCLTFVSINTVVMGMLSLWGTDIDMVSMATLLMSVGFSVDYTVHMAFTYSRQPHGTTTKQRIDLALDAVAVPIMQSGASTLVAVSLMLLVQSYMMRVFLKTIVLVVGAGLFETLFFLPTAWQLLDAHAAPLRHQTICRQRKRKQLCGNTTEKQPPGPLNECKQPPGPRVEFTPPLGPEGCKQLEEKKTNGVIAAAFVDVVLNGGAAVHHANNGVDHTNVAVVTNGHGPKHCSSNGHV